jgi:hypothetical protein
MIVCSPEEGVKEEFSALQHRPFIGIRHSTADISSKAFFGADARFTVYRRT